MVLLGQAAIYLIPNYEYAYFSGEVYLPKVPANVQEYYSPVVHGASGSWQLPGRTEVTTVSGLFGILPGDGMHYLPHADVGGYQLFLARSSNLRYNAGHCPNVLSWEELLPGACENLGKSKWGSQIYGYAPSLPSGRYIAYTNIGGTFVVAMGGFMAGGEDMKAYINSLERIPAWRVAGHIAEGKRRADATAAQMRAAAQAKEDYEASGYQRLTFNPVMPAHAPSGWKLSGRTLYARQSGEVALAEYIYIGPDKDRDLIEIFVGRKELFQLNGPNGTCGPTPRFGTEYLPCGKVPGENYYMVSYVGQDNDLIGEVRYQEIGDLVIATTMTYRDKSLVMPESLRRARDLLTKDYRPVEKAFFKDAFYSSPL